MFLGFGYGVIARRACGVSDGISGNTKVYGVYIRGRCDIWVVNVEWASVVDFVRGIGGTTQTEVLLHVLALIKANTTLVDYD